MSLKLCAETIYGDLFNPHVAITESTRRLVNVRLHMKFRPELIYIFDLIVNQMKR